MADDRSFGESAEMYLKTIYELSDADALVPISALAQRLDISAVSATEKIHHLRRKGLLTHTPYKGVRLTKKGRRSALAVIRRHRLWERFLTDMLKLPWEEVHEMACNLEHAAGPKVTEALGAYLDQPATCPHGNPIPITPDELSVPDDPQLNALPVGASGVVRRVCLESRVVLQHLALLGIRPGSRISVAGVEPLGGPRKINMGDCQLNIGDQMASHIMINTRGPQEEQDAAR